MNPKEEKEKSKKRGAFWLWFKNPKNLTLVGVPLLLVTLLISLTAPGQSSSSSSTVSSSTSTPVSSQTSVSPSSSTAPASSSQTPTTSTSPSTQAAFTLNFQTNGGSSIASIEVLGGSTFAEPTPPTRTGYTFAGWFYDNTTFNQPVSFPATMPQSSLTIYAKWTLNQYSITFVTNGGSSISAITINFGATITLPTTTKEGYTFDGWFKDDNLSIPFTDTTMPNENLTLYAKWVVRQFPLIYGYTDLPSINVAFGTTITLADLPTPTKVGHTFNGWFTNGGLSTPFVSITMPATTLTIYAKFTINTYTITFVTNGGSSVNSITAQYDSNITLYDSFKTGYTFGGWYRDEALTTVFSGNKMPAENTTLYAKWNINQYTVSYRIMYQEDFQDTISGEQHSLALNLDGTLFVWGYNTHGQLGLGESTLFAGRPTVLNTDNILLQGESISKIQTGPLASTSYFITSNGRVFGWGNNAYGQVGNGSSTNQVTPVEINFPNLAQAETITRIFPGANHTFALSTAGNLFAWGANQAGQLGLGNTTSFNTPQLVTFTDLNSGETILGISPGGEKYNPSFGYSIAYTSTGRLSTWGHNNGKLGDGTNTARNAPVTFTVAALSGGETITSVTASTTFIVARTSNGRILSWGASNNALGLGSTTNKDIPTLVTFSALTGGESLTAVTASTTHVVAISTNNRIFVWGLNDGGQLGQSPMFLNASNTPILASFTLNAGETLTHVAGGGRGYSVLLTSSYRIIAWGFNEYYELGNNTGGANANVTMVTPMNQVFLGDNFEDALTLDFGATLTLPTVTLTGFTFVNWYQFESFNSVYNAPATMPAQNIEIYAGFIRTSIPA